MLIRFLTELDLKAYSALRLHSLQESPASFGSSFEQESKFSPQEFAARIRPHGDPANGLFGAFTSSNQLAGTIGFSREIHLKRAHIGSVWGMYVLPEFRGQGIGAALLDEALGHARRLPGLRQVTLTVTARNLPAIGLYESRGFERFGVQRDALCVNGHLFDEEHWALYLVPVSTPVKQQS
jgi:ribosomal protein S18 acetylase RimI-like enzyme